MNGIKGALQLFYIDVGRYPNQAEGLLALVGQPPSAQNWRGPYLEVRQDISDPWGREYIYRSPGKEKAFDLSTYGRDGHPGGVGEDSDLSL